MKKGVRELVAEADAQVVAIDVAEARGLQGADDVVFVDLRDPREREREGAIPGAFSCPRGMLEFWVDPESPYHKPVFAEGKRYLFYCAAGQRSALAAKTVEDMGLDNVAHLAGGFKAWGEAGAPVEPIAPKPRKT